MIAQWQHSQVEGRLSNVGLSIGREDDVVEVTEALPAPVDVVRGYHEHGLREFFVSNFAH